MIISVDPGYKGGLAYFDENFKLKEYMKMPVIVKNKKNELDIEKINKFFFKYKYTNTVVYIEDIHALPKMNIQAMFRFGEQLGILKALSISNILKYELVPIKTWKKYFKLTSDKVSSVKLANKLFNLNLKKTDDGIAEAILIGKYVIDTKIKQKV